LHGSFADKEQKEIILSGVSYHAFKVLVNYIETENLNCSSFQKVEFDDLLALSDYLDIKSFKSALVEYLEEKLAIFDSRVEELPATEKINGYQLLSEFDNSEVKDLLKLCRKYHLENLRNKIDSFLFNSIYRNWEIDAFSEVCIEKLAEAGKYGLEKSEKQLLADIFAAINNVSENACLPFVAALLMLHRHCPSYWEQIWLEASAVFKRHPGWFGTFWEKVCESKNEALRSQLSSFCLHRENYDIALYNSPVPEKTFGLSYHPSQISEESL
jgi:hypothetical protein